MCQFSVSKLHCFAQLLPGCTGEHGARSPLPAIAPIAHEDYRANNDSGNPQRATLRFRHIKIAIVTAAASTIKAGRISPMRAT
jgi:hypothetical protein